MRPTGYAAHRRAALAPSPCRPSSTGPRLHPVASKSTGRRVPLSALCATSHRNWARLVKLVSIAPATLLKGLSATLHDLDDSVDDLRLVNVAAGLDAGRARAGRVEDDHLLCIATDNNVGVVGRDYDLSTLLEPAEDG